MKRFAQPLLFVIFFVVFLGLHWVPVPTIFSKYFQVGVSGTVDLSAYWSAFELNQEGKNPYAPVELHAKQVAIGLPADSTMMVWNPPWLFLLLHPLLTHDLPEAAALWFILNIAFFFFGLVLLSHAYQLSSSTRIALFACGLCSFPAYSTVVLGQLSIMLFFALAIFAVAIKQQSKLTGTLALLFLSLKPHLVFLLWAYLLAELWHHKKNSWGFYFGCSFVGLLAVTALYDPLLFRQWLGVYDNFAPQQGAYSIYAWRAPTLVSELREVLASYSGTLSRLLMWGIPSIAFLSAFLLFAKRKTPIHLESVLPLLVLVSNLLSPFGWVFDQTLLLLPVAAWLGREHRPRSGIAVMIVIHLLYFSIASTEPKALPYLYCYPLALASMWFWTSTGERKVVNSPETS